MNFQDATGPYNRGGMRANHDRHFLQAISSLILATFTASIAFAQSHPPSVTSIKSVDGTVEAISGDVIYVTTGVRLIALSVDDRTEVWKGKTLHGLSTVEVGDDIVALHRTDASGKNVATLIRLNGVNFFAVVTNIISDGFEVFTNPNADPKSGYRKENKIVSVDADTTFEQSAKEDLRVGRAVQVMGLDRKNGTILATRVTVYEGNRPVRMENGRIILPNGQIR